jgi:xanthine dehydrogenase YagR molybdenum-binding subunit
MATGQWDALQMFGRAQAVLHRDGRLVVESAASDIGTGTYTVMAQIAAAALALPLEQVVFRLGDSTLPIAPIEGGSSHVATIGSAVAGACEKIRHKLWRLARALPRSPLSEVRYGDVEFVQGAIRRRGDAASAILYTDLIAASGYAGVRDRYLVVPNKIKQRKYVCASHSAIFCEARVDEELGMVRVTRLVSAFAAGRIISAKTALSQVMGGMVWGISQALHEETHTDHRLGRYMNHNYAEYHIPVNADIHGIEAILVEEDDRIVSALGAKGVGEIGIVGVAAAVSNALFHATGRRIRSTPMTPDKVMAPGEGWPAADGALGINGERGATPTQREF